MGRESPAETSECYRKGIKLGALVVREKGGELAFARRLIAKRQERGFLARPRTPSTVTTYAKAHLYGLADHVSRGATLLA